MQEGRVKAFDANRAPLACQSKELWAAVEGGDVDGLVKILDDRPELIDARDASRFGWTLLCAAAASGQCESAKALLRADSVMLNRPDCRGWTPLHLAARYGRVHTIDTLLRASSDAVAIDARDHDGWTPLYTAAASGQLDAVQRLVRCAGETLDVRTRAGWSPVHIAAVCRHSDIVDLLRSVGADVRGESFSRDVAMELERPLSDAQITEHRRRVFFRESLLGRLLTD